MGLMGKDVAFIPIGLSCQVAMQLVWNRDFLSLLAGEPLTYTSSFLNWTLIDSLSVPAVLEDLTTSPISHSFESIPRLSIKMADRGVWLWHEKWGTDVTDEIFASVVTKYEHLRQNFCRLTQRSVRIFLLGAGQDDLDGQYPVIEGDMRIRLTPALVQEVRQTIDRLFPHGENHLFVAGSADRIDESAGYVFPGTNIGWQGSMEDWQRFLVAPTFTALGRHAVTMLDSMKNERDAMAQERDRQAEEREAVDRDRGIAQLERDGLKKERDVLQLELTRVRELYAPVRKIYKALRVGQIRRTISRLGGKRY